MPRPTLALEQLSPSLREDSCSCREFRYHKRQVFCTLDLVRCPSPLAAVILAHLFKYNLCHLNPFNCPGTPVRLRQRGNPAIPASSVNMIYALYSLGCCSLPKLSMAVATTAVVIGSIGNITIMGGNLGCRELPAPKSLITSILPTDLETREYRFDSGIHSADYSPDDRDKVRREQCLDTRPG